MTFQRAELGHSPARQIGEIGMALVQPVLLDPAHEGPVGPIQARLRRGVQIGIVADECRACLVHRRRPPAAVRGYRLEPGQGFIQGRPPDPLDRRPLALDVAHGVAATRDVAQAVAPGDALGAFRIAERGGEEDLARLLIDAVQALHRPRAIGDRPDHLTVAVVQIQVLPPGLFRRPDEVPVLQRLETGFVALQLLDRLGQDHTAGARGRIDAQQVQRLLVPRLALHIQSAPIGRPVDPRQINVGVFA